MIKINWALTEKRGYNEFNSNVPLLLSIANVMYPIRVFDSVVRCDVHLCAVTNIVECDVKLPIQTSKKN